MREAQIILPTQHNGAPGAIKQTRVRVAETFGGYTADVAFGAWRNPKTGELIEEPVERLTIACADTPENAQALLGICRKFGAEARQDCVYVRLPSGDAHIIQTCELWGDTSDQVAIAA